MQIIFKVQSYKLILTPPNIIRFFFLPDHKTSGCPIHLVSECPIHLALIQALLNTPYTKHFVIFTATTATFGINTLISNVLSGGSKGGSRVTEVAVEAVF